VTDARNAPLSKIPQESQVEGSGQVGICDPGASPVMIVVVESPRKVTSASALWKETPIVVQDPETVVFADGRIVTPWAGPTATSRSWAGSPLPPARGSAAAAEAELGAPGGRALDFTRRLGASSERPSRRHHARDRCGFDHQTPGVVVAVCLDQHRNPAALDESGELERGTPEAVGERSGGNGVHRQIESRSGEFSSVGMTQVSRAASCQEPVSP
jgi:hypothetical protein